MKYISDPMNDDENPDDEAKPVQDERHVVEGGEQQVEQPEQPEPEVEKSEDKAAMRKRETQETALKIIEAARQRPNEVSVNSLSAEFGVGKPYVRRILTANSITLPSQQQFFEQGVPKEEVDARIIGQVTRTEVSAQTRQWAESLTHDMIEDQRLVGQVVCDELRPLALSQGKLVSQLIEEALEDQKTLQGLKDQYGSQASDFGHDNVLEYLRLTARFHQENHSAPVEMEEIRGLIKEFVAEREYEARVNHLVGLLVSGRKEDKAKFILETMGGGQ